MLKQFDINTTLIIKYNYIIVYQRYSYAEELRGHAIVVSVISKMNAL